MKNLVLVSASGAIAAIVALLLGGAAALSALLNEPPGSLVTPAPHEIPGNLLVDYQRAATACPGLSWTVLAAIGTIESDNGESPLPGVTSGHNSAGAVGPMQFEPATFAAYSRPVPPGGADPPDPYDPLDASFAAARLLCAHGAAQAGGLPQAVLAYNHSAGYVAAVLGLAGTLAFARASGGPGARIAVQFALDQVGTPYRWGAEDPGVAFDCSGLVQAAWAAAGAPLPRVAQDQFDAGPLVPAGALLEPGDLVFFGAPGGGVTHVGLVVDGFGRMVDAPHTGAAVRVESFPLTVGAAWGGDVFLGATRPDGVQGLASPPVPPG
jgi:cell wall-associated NlpC family hydrolase